jgi:ketosteroid isomerase-like protein
VTAADDRDAIRRCVELYARGADRRDPALVASVFADDGVLQIYDGDPNESGTLNRERNGPVEIEAAMHGLARYRVTSHVLGQSTIDLAGSTATSETYCIAHHLTDHDDGTTSDRVMSIRYLDDWVRTSKGWRLACRRLALDWLDHRIVTPPPE